MGPALVYPEAGRGAGMTAGVSVRTMVAGDLEAVIQLLGILFAQEADFTPDAARQRHALRVLLEDPDRGTVLVAEREGRVIGNVVLLRSLSTALGQDVCWLEDFVVDPAERGRGVGHRLLAAAEAEAVRRGWSRITLLTDADNERAQGLYRAHGFTRSSMAVLRRGLTPSVRP